MLQDTHHYHFGCEKLGPVFAAFACLLLRQARIDQVKELAFVARDGYLLMQATQRLIAAHPGESAPECRYVHLSRISTILPACNIFTDEQLSESLSIRAGETTLASQLAFLGLDVDLLRPAITNAGFDTEKAVQNIEPLRALLTDTAIRHAIDAQRQQQTTLLKKYLLQNRILGNPACALVDIGWRGSILASLSHAFNSNTPSPLRCYYLGYWHEQGVISPPHGIAQGIVSDFGRSRQILEGSAYFMSLPLEAICRSNHGTTRRYSEKKGQIVPLLQACDSEARKTDCRSILQAGILDYIENHAQEVTDLPSQTLRKHAQQRLLRLAFLPSEQEIACIEGLEHNEGHNTTWSVPLVQAARPSPWRTPRRWLAGLSSPWRGGYIVATGGRMLGFAYLITEAMLAALPRDIRQRLRRQALRISVPD